MMRRLLLFRSVTQNYNVYNDISELPDHIFEEIKHFFTVYKNLENKETAVNEVSGREAPVEIIEKAIDDEVEKFCK